MTCSWRWLSIGAAAAMSVAGLGAGVSMMTPDAGAAGSPELLAPNGTAALTPAASSSSDVAGYRVVDKSGVTSFSSTVTVPTLKCPKAGTYSAYLSTQVVGTTVSGGDFVHLACVAGAPEYTGFIVFTTVTNGEKPFTVAAGNTLQWQITVKETKKSNTDVHTTITDTTTGVVTNKSVTYKGVAKDTTAWDVIEHVGKASVPPFGTNPWSTAQSNGVTLEAAGATHYNMTETGTVLVSASKLGPTGSAFTDTFHKSD
jgi:hypothetical protein